MSRALGVAQFPSDELFGERYLSPEKTSLEARFGHFRFYQKDIRALEENFGFIISEKNC
jgi:hypothetical protein